MSEPYRHSRRPKPRWLRRLRNTFVLAFVGMNLFAAIHGYKFTHFKAAGTPRTRDESEMSPVEKLRTILFGVSLPKPVNDETPKAPFRTIQLTAPARVEAWMLSSEASRGTVILFHGYGGCRSGMLAKAERIRALGYDCLLPDFTGAGGSEGNSCTIGYREASQVRLWYDWLRQRDTGRIFLLGQSMGAAAIMKAMQEAPMPVAGLMLECPYGSMLRTVENRFRSIGLPSFPMAPLLVFWGGTLQGFNAFSLRPESYAKSLSGRVLLMRGSVDDRVSADETEEIYKNIPGSKQLLILPGAGHNDFLERCGPQWDEAVAAFLR